MATAAERRAAQRATAKAVRERRRQLPASINRRVQQTRQAYAYDVIAGREPMPTKGSREGNNLASLAAKARWGKADPKFEKAFSHLWYHKEQTTAAEEDMYDNDEHMYDEENGLLEDEEDEI